MRSCVLALAGLVACASAPASDDDELGGGKDDRGTSSRFVEVDPTHTNATFRAYIEKALDKLAAQDSDLARLTVQSIAAGKVRIDELSDLTCNDFERVRKDLPDLGLTAEDYALLKRRGSEITAAIAGEIDGYMWSNRIYVSRGQTAQRLAATLVHEVNHVINRSEVGYYDDLPTSAFLHEYRAFHAERMFDPAEYAGLDLVDYVVTTYELDRDKIAPAVLASPLTPRLLPDADAWRARAVDADVPDPACP
jgi:hypothetical protein